MNEQLRASLERFLQRRDSTEPSFWLAEAEAMLTNEEWKLYENLIKKKQKDPTVAWVLWGLLGFLGIHRLYLGHTGKGLLYMFTFGLFGIGFFSDLFTLGAEMRDMNIAMRIPVVYSILSARLAND